MSEEQPKPFMWVLRAFRSRGPDLVGYDSMKLLNMALSVLGRYSGVKREGLKGNVITLYDNGTWKQGVHDE